MVGVRTVEVSELVWHAADASDVTVTRPIRRLVVHIQLYHSTRQTDRHSENNRRTQCTAHKNNNSDAEILFLSEGVYGITKNPRSDMQKI